MKKTVKPRITNIGTMAKLCSSCVESLDEAGCWQAPYVTVVKCPRYIKIKDTAQDATNGE